ncbi:MucR family transcriptional regulator [Pseudovibrio ascidiaceicola]|uniref:MucR family transcriptional regulator n=1 Tax=Pseudovibrio ascidiaceicola TaxID=285279 RepID=UPI003D366EEC
MAEQRQSSLTNTLMEGVIKLAEKKVGHGDCTGDELSDFITKVSTAVRDQTAVTLKTLSEIGPDGSTSSPATPEPAQNALPPSTQAPVESLPLTKPKRGRPRAVRTEDVASESVSATPAPDAASSSKKSSDKKTIYAQFPNIPREPFGGMDPLTSNVGSHIVCLIDGKEFKTMKRHLLSNYNMTADQYREFYGLPGDFALSSTEYSEKRRKIADKTFTPKGRGKPVTASSEQTETAPNAKPRRGRKSSSSGRKILTAT